MLMKRMYEGFKQVVLTSMVNKRIVSEYKRYCELSQLEVIFTAMKRYTFEEKLLRKRADNLKRIIKGTAVFKMLFNMRVAMYGSYKKR